MGSASADALAILTFFLTLLGGGPVGETPTTPQRIVTPVATPGAVACGAACREHATAVQHAETPPDAVTVRTDAIMVP